MVPYYNNNYEVRVNILMNIFSPAPYIEEIQDQEKVKADYRFWRVRILYSTLIGYALYYFTRKSFIFAMPGLIEDLGYDKSQLGLLASVMAISYGISKFASGIISDRSNPRYFMALGLFLTGVCNIAFGFSSSLLMFAIFWGLNGWFQGFGWPPCARFLTHWYSQSERGSWWSTWNISHNLGAFIIPWIVGYCLQYYGWRYAMFVPGTICILGSLFLINRLRDTPQSLGLPPIEKFRNDYGGKTEEEVRNEHELTTKEILVEYVLKNRYIWILACAYFFVYVVRTGVTDWTALYLLETKGYSRIGASGCVSLFEVGGFFGSLSAGWISDKLFQARRGPVNVIYATCILIAVTLFWFVPAGYPWLDSLSMFLIGMSIFGPQMMIGMTAAELSHKKAAATSTGFIGSFAYLGAATAGYPLGMLAQEWGWYGFFAGLVASALLAVMLLIPMWNIKDRFPAKERKPELA